MFKKTNKKGFTLIELIVVVAIMAVLVALLAPNVFKYLERTKVKKDTNSLDSVRTGIEAELMDEVLSAYSTNESEEEGATSDPIEGVLLADIFAAASETATEGAALLGYRLFRTEEQVLDDDFATADIFVSKAATGAQIAIYVDGNGGVAVAAVNEDGIISYEGQPVIVSTKIDLGDFDVASNSYANLDNPTVS